MKKYWFLVLIIVFHLVFNFVWLGLNKTPPAWDQAAHIRSSVIWNRALIGESSFNFKQLIGQSWGYPPLIMFLGGIWSLVFGIGIAQITFLNTLFLIGGIVGVYFLTKELSKSDLSAGIAAFLFSFFPVIFDISRNFLLDLPLTVFIIWAIWSFIKSNCFLNFKYSFLFLLFFVLSSLTKLNGFLYFLPIFIYAVYFAIKSKKIKIIKNLIIMAVFYGIGVGWWWIINFSNIYQYLTGLAGQGEPLADPMDLFKLETWFYYLKLFFLQQVSPIVALIFFGALGFWKKLKITKENKVLFLLFLIVNYLVFTIIKNKDFRFTMPLLPMVAVIMGLGFLRLREFNKWIFGFLFGFLSLFLLFNYFSNSFEWPIKKDYKLSWKMPLIGWADFINISEYPVRSFKMTVWPQEEIIKNINDNSRLLVLINKEEINDNNLWLYRELANKEIIIESVGNRNRFNNEEEIGELLSQMDYVLVPDITYEAAPFYVINLEAYNQARDYVLNQKDNWKLINTYQIYDGKNLFLMKKI